MAANKSIAFKNRELVFSAVHLGSPEGLDIALTFLTDKNPIINNM